MYFIFLNAQNVFNATHLTLSTAARRVLTHRMVGTQARLQKREPKQFLIEFSHKTGLTVTFTFYKPKTLDSLILRLQVHSMNIFNNRCVQLLSTYRTGPPSV